MAKKKKAAGGIRIPGGLRKGKATDPTKKHSEERKHGKHACLEGGIRGTKEIAAVL